MVKSLIKVTEIRVLIVLFIIFFTPGFVEFSSGQNNYFHYIDSADALLPDHPKKSISILKSVPGPIETTMKGKLAEYYESLAFAYYHNSNHGLAHRYILIAAKNAEKVENYQLAGRLYNQAFRLSRQVNDNLDEELLDKAIENFTKANYAIGILEVEQARAYDHYLSKKYKKCIEVGLSNRERFNIKGAIYLKLVNDYLICSSYFRLGDYKNGMDFYATVLDYGSKDGITDYDMSFHTGVLDYDISRYFLKKNQSDSSLFYFNKIAKNKSNLGYWAERLYYELGSDLYELKGNSEISSAYSDSLEELDRNNSKSSLKETIEANEQLLSATESLTESKSETKWVTIILIIIGLVALLALFLIWNYRRKMKVAAINLKEKTEESFSGKKKQQKLSAKINQLEGHITDIKTEVKKITNEEAGTEQRNKLQQLYMEINVKSNVMSDQDHLLVVNELNEEFFARLENAHPDLNDSELAICYYLFLGFKNKEIAAFRNTTVRAIESRRFRLTKKINARTAIDKLIPYLNSLMEGAKIKNHDQSTS